MLRTRGASGGADRIDAPVIGAQEASGRPLSRWAVALGVVTMLLLAACGGDASADAVGVAGTGDADNEPGAGDDDDADVADADAAVAGDAASQIPDGTVLRVASQQQSQDTAFELSGELEDLPFEIEWINLHGGPAILEAIRGGSVDVAPVGVIPAIHAYAAGDDVPAILATRSDPGNMRIAISVDSDIETIDDIEPGTRIAFADGTIHAGNILRLLDRAGLEPDEVELVRVPTTETVEVLQANEVELGSVDGQRLARFVAAYGDDGAGALPAEETYGIADQPGVLYASRAALDDPAKDAALAVFLEHYVRALKWVNDNPETWVEEYYVNIQQVTEEDGWAIVEAGGDTVFPRLDDDLLADIQELIDLLEGAGELQDGIEAADIWDVRYSEVIEQAVDAAGAAHDRDEAS